MAVVEVKVPDIGDFKNVEIIEVLVKPGDTIRVEQSLVTVESDKASMEIPSTHAGVVREMKVAMGDKVSQGTLLLLVEANDAAAAAAPAVAHAPAVSPAPASSPAAQLTAASSPASAAPGGRAVTSEPAPSAAPAPAPTAASAPAAGGSIDIVVPDIGDFADVGVIEVLVKPGDTVTAEQSLITVESDKASMEIPSSAGGVVREMLVKVGDRVAKGTRIAVLAGEGGAAGASPAAAPASAATSVDAAPAARASASAASRAAPSGDAGGGASTPAAGSATPERTSPTAALPAHEPTAPTARLPHASPSIRKAARELGVPLEEVTGSGPKGRILQSDLEGFVQAVMRGDARTRAAAAKAPASGVGSGGTGGSGGAGPLANLLAWPQVDFTKFGPVERKDLSRIKKISGANLHRNWVMIPHVTNHDDADITELEAFRVTLNKEYEKAGVKVTMLAFLIKACVAALKKFPEFNASLDGDQLVLKRYFHIGFAADTPNGLMVPVVRDADQKGIVQIAKEMNELAAKARDGKLSPAEMTGGCFSISSLGGIGGTYFTPIINAPEVAILGVCRSSTRPVWDGHAFVPRLILPLSLSWDHRVVDGASAARFNAYLVQVLGDFRRILL